jgi:hypothetical protein
MGLRTIQHEVQGGEWGEEWIIPHRSVSAKKKTSTSERELFAK